MKPVSIDIVIVNYRCAADTLQALARLAQWPHGILWLVDNSAQDVDIAADTAALHLASAGIPWVRILTPGSNVGFGCACNLSFAESKAEFFLLLNPDARMAADDVVLLANALTDQPALGAVSPKIFWNEQRTFVLPVASPQTPGHRMAMALATHSRTLTKWTVQHSLNGAMRQMDSKTTFEVPFIAGAVMLLRRKAVLSAGGLFDPDYFMFFEDSDLSVRLRRAGFSLAMVPTACAVHEYRHKAFKAGMMETSLHQYFSKQYPLFYRWSGRLSRVAALARPVNPAKWFNVISEPVTSAQEFATCTHNGRVLAFSPSLLMMPALFRPAFEDARSFSAQEWAMLEPAIYTALVQSTDSTRKQEWFYFERAAA